MLELQLSNAHLVLEKVDVFPELGDGIKRSIVLERQPANLIWGTLRKKCILRGKIMIYSIIQNVLNIIIQRGF